MPDPHVHARVQVLQLVERGLRPRRLAHMLPPTVEVSADVLNSHRVRVVDSDLLRPGEDEVLGDLDAELGNGGSTPVIPWTKTLRDMSLPCASWP